MIHDGAFDAQGLRFPAELQRSVTPDVGRALKSGHVRLLFHLLLERPEQTCRSGKLAVRLCERDDAAFVNKTPAQPARVSELAFRVSAVDARQEQRGSRAFYGVQVNVEIVGRFPDDDVTLRSVGNSYPGQVELAQGHVSAAPGGVGDRNCEAVVVGGKQQHRIGPVDAQRWKQPEA